MTRLIYQNGYCTSPCRPAQTDMTTGLNADCPNDNATCQLVSQTAGRCVAECQSAASDCREAEDYECEYNTPNAASCTPKGPDWCDPKMPKSCPKAMDGHPQICADYSPDQSYGNCAEQCDVFLQDCPMAMNPLACIVFPMTGVSTCIGAGPGFGPCRYLNDCAPGSQCHQKKGGMPLCSPYCRVNAGGGVPDVKCPANWICVDLKTGMPLNMIALGICEM